MIIIRERIDFGYTIQKKAESERDDKKNNRLYIQNKGTKTNKGAGRGRTKQEQTIQGGGGRGLIHYKDRTKDEEARK